MTIAEKVVSTLKMNKQHITVAESCTGGSLASAIVGVDGASNVFDVGFVTYSEESKIAVLGVKKETIQKFGIVSEEVAMEMAQGACSRCGAEIGVGITGWAGSISASGVEVSGLVCFGFCINGFNNSVKVRFQGARLSVIKDATNFALKSLVQMLR